MALFDRAALKPGVRPAEVWGWALFDAANSGYSTVVLTAVFNAYFVATVCAGASWGTLLWTCAVAAANAIGLVVMPAIARAADLTARKKSWLVAATLVCIIATALLALVGPGDYALAVVLIIVSNLGYSIGETLNSAFLPEIAQPDGLGRVSGWGWSLGYMGGLLTLGLCLGAVTWGTSRGYTTESMVPVTNLITAGVFLVLAVPLFVFLRERAVAQVRRVQLRSVFRSSLTQLAQTVAELPRYRDFAGLVVCGFFYQCGIATVITLSAIYASAVMGFTMVDTLILVLLVNITAALGAFGFGYVQDRLGHKRALALTLAVWVLMVVTAACATSAPLFWVSANLAGLAMGSSQSAGRAMVAVLAPERRLAEFYGLWNMALWTAAIVGPLTYGVVTWVTANNQRLAIAVTGLFFLCALVALIPIDMRRGSDAARSGEPQHGDGAATELS